MFFVSFGEEGSPIFGEAKFHGINTVSGRVNAVESDMVSVNPCTPQVGANIENFVLSIKVSGPRLA